MPKNKKKNIKKAFGKVFTKTENTYLPNSTRSWEKIAEEFKPDGYSVVEVHRKGIISSARIYGFYIPKNSQARSQVFLSIGKKRWVIKF